MTTKSLSNLIEDGESAAVEFKRALDKGLGRELCAFANADGGTILLGVSDSGRIVGISQLNRAKSRIESTARSADPSIDIQVERVGEVLAVVVPRQGCGPYSFGGRFYRRHGATSQQMSRTEIEEMFYSTGRIRYDGTSCDDFDFEADLDDGTWRTFVRRARIPATMDRIVALRNLGLVDAADRMVRAGAWLVARDIRRFEASAHVSCALFLGHGKDRILDRRDFVADIATMIDDVVAWLLAKINVEFVIEHVQREERPELPEPALREAVANAVAHRDYRSPANVQVYVFRDRIEIVSPGGLPPGMTEADLGTKSMPRNPLLFGMLYRMGAVEHIGSGIRRIRELCRRHGVAQPIIEATDTWVTVTFRRPDPPDQEGDQSHAAQDARRGSESSAASRGPESAHADGPELRRGPEFEPTVGPELQSGPEWTGAERRSLPRRVLDVLASESLSKSAIARRLGHRSVSAGLNRVIRRLRREGRIAYTLPERPTSRHQAYRITRIGRSAAASTDP